nr:HAD-IC family P-type ATPase [Desulfobacula sp.]
MAAPPVPEKSLALPGPGKRRPFPGRLTIDLLDAAAIGISLIRRDARSVTIITTLLAVSEFLMQWTRKHSQDQLVRDLLHLPDRVWLLQDGREVSCPADRVRPGDKVVVRTGSRIPVDGVILEGEAVVNQASMTGEPLGVSKSPGITVFAGTVVEEGRLVISADQVGDATRAVKILKILETSERVKAGLESRAEQWADRVVPLTLALSALTLILTRDLNRAASVLLVDFSCAIKLSTPLTMLSAMREASTRGVLIKGGRYLEKLEQADTFIFDKTGTLTQAAPMATGVVGFNGHQPRDVLCIAACLEEHFPHPLAGRGGDGGTGRPGPQRGTRRTRIHPGPRHRLSVERQAGPGRQPPFPSGTRRGQPGPGPGNHGPCRSPGIIPALYGHRRRTGRGHPAGRPGPPRCLPVPGRAQANRYPPDHHAHRRWRGERRHRGPQTGH